MLEWTSEILLSVFELAGSLVIVVVAAAAGHEEYPDLSMNHQKSTVECPPQTLLVFPMSLSQ